MSGKGKKATGDGSKDSKPKDSSEPAKIASQKSFHARQQNWFNQSADLVRTLTLGQLEALHGHIAQELSRRDRAVCTVIPHGNRQQASQKAGTKRDAQGVPKGNQAKPIAQAPAVSAKPKELKGAQKDGSLSFKEMGLKFSFPVTNHGIISKQPLDGSFFRLTPETWDNFSEARHQYTRVRVLRLNQDVSWYNLAVVFQQHATLDILDIKKRQVYFPDGKITAEGINKMPGLSSPDKKILLDRLKIWEDIKLTISEFKGHITSWIDAQAATKIFRGPCPELTGTNDYHNLVLAMAEGPESPNTAANRQAFNALRALLISAQLARGRKSPSRERHFLLKQNRDDSSMDCDKPGDSDDGAGKDPKPKKDKPKKTDSTPSTDDTSARKTRSKLKEKPKAPPSEKPPKKKRRRSSKKKTVAFSNDWSEECTSNYNVEEDFVRSPSSSPSRSPPKRKDRSREQSVDSTDGISVELKQMEVDESKDNWKNLPKPKRSPKVRRPDGPPKP